MVNDLKDLMRGSVADAPSDDIDVASVVATGRRRVRTRRMTFGAGVATLTAAAVVGTAVLAGGSGDGPDAAGQRREAPPAVGPVVLLADARPAVEGVDYDLLTTHEVKDLESEPSMHVEGVTDDGQLLLVESNTSSPARVTLIDSSTGARDELPRARVTTLVEATDERLVFLGPARGDRPRTTAQVFDRSTRTWSRVGWPGLPDADGHLTDAIGIGPDDRLYLALRREYEPNPPELWSVSLTDPTDVRDEDLPADRVDLTDGLLSWTDSDEPPTGALHVRDLATGEQIELEVPGGEACGTSIERGAGIIALSQYCGTYEGVRDERVVLLDEAGGVIATIRGTSLGSGGFAGAAAVVASSANGGEAGTYVYDVAGRELIELTGEAPYGPAVDPAPDGVLAWNTQTGRYGATYHVAEWRG